MNLARAHSPFMFLGGFALAACGQGSEPPTDGFSGPGVEVNVAALNLVDVGDVIWDLEVLNTATTPRRRSGGSG